MNKRIITTINCNNNGKNDDDNRQNQQTDGGSNPKTSQKNQKAITITISSAEIFQSKEKALKRGMDPK
jgi:hypothetical protein